MKLFSETKSAPTDGDNKPAPRQRKYDATQPPVAIISPRSELRTEIASHLLMHNIENLIEVDDDFLTLQNDDGIQNAAVVIIDIASAWDVEQINDKVIMLIPTQARVFIVGDSDSIAFAESLITATRRPYLHAGSQLAQLAQAIQSKETGRVTRSAIVMSILGCKGGVGTSTIAWQLFQAMGKQATIPMLLVQGASGSRDLDLLMEQALPTDGSSLPVGTRQAVYMETIDGMLNYRDTRFNQFNLVFIDHAIHNLSHEQLEQVIAHSHTQILVITRELSSVRVAKRMLDENRRRSRGGSAPEARILICLNESHPASGHALKNSDIEEYLECDIAVVNPWDGKNSGATPGSALYHFATWLLGKSTTQQAPQNKLLSLFRRRAS